jgi:hypothetical protein
MLVNKTDARKNKKAQNKAARQGTEQQLLTLAEFDAHVLSGLQAIAHLADFNLLLSIPAAGLGGFDMEGRRVRMTPLVRAFTRCRRPWWTQTIGLF